MLVISVARVCGRLGSFLLLKHCVITGTFSGCRLVLVTIDERELFTVHSADSCTFLKRVIFH